jgi:hypothetical protein
MSDDEFGLDEDEFFSHPDLLANVEKVEQEHRQLTQGVQKPAPAGSKSDTSGKVGQGERKVSGGYHHAVARPAAGFGRGRGEFQAGFGVDEIFPVKGRLTVFLIFLGME